MLTLSNIIYSQMIQACKIMLLRLLLVVVNLVVKAVWVVQVDPVVPAATVVMVV